MTLTAPERREYIELLTRKIAETEETRQKCLEYAETAAKEGDQAAVDKWKAGAENCDAYIKSLANDIAETRNRWK